MQQVIALIAPALGLAHPVQAPMALPFRVLAAVEAAQPGAMATQDATLPQADTASQTPQPK